MTVVTFGGQWMILLSPQAPLADDSSIEQEQLWQEVELLMNSGQIILKMMPLQKILWSICTLSVCSHFPNFHVISHCTSEIDQGVEDNTQWDHFQETNIDGDYAP